MGHPNLHPLFASILDNVIAQPAMLVRAENKANKRRFSPEPVRITGFGALDDKVGDEFASGLDCVDDERDPERELQDDMRADMARRSR